MEVDDIPSIFILLSADLANLNINVDWCDEHFLDLDQYWEGRWNVARLHVIMRLSFVFSHPSYGTEFRVRHMA